MQGRSPRFAAYGAAGVLAVVVLFVFFILQDYGPESAVRRFHEAAARGDLRTIQELTKRGSSDEATIRLASQLRFILISQGARYRLMRMDRRPGEVGAEVAYVYPGGQVAGLYWIVRKGPGERSWRIDVERTLNPMPMLGG